MTSTSKGSDLDPETARIRASGRVLRHKEDMMAKRREQRERRAAALERDAARIDIGAEEI